MFEQAVDNSFSIPLAPAVVHSPGKENASAPPDPLSFIRDMRREIDGLFKEAMQDLHGNNRGFDDGWSNLAITPGMTVNNKGDAYEITVALPSVDKSDIQLGMDGSILTLIVGHKESRSVPERLSAPPMRSQHISRFEQRLRLPGADPNPDHIKAFFEKGVLHIKVPKTPSTEQKTGAIKVI